MTLSRREFMIGTGVAMATPALAHGDVHEVAIRNFGFEPEVLHLQAGEHVRFTNHDLAPHTATANDHSWDTGTLNKGDSIEVMIGPDWTPDYYCTFHPQMKAQLVIKS